MLRTESAWEPAASKLRLMTSETDQPNQTVALVAARDYSHAWRALRHRNFRLFFGGQSISLIGTWMTRVATSWLD